MKIDRFLQDLCYRAKTIMNNVDPPIRDLHLWKIISVMRGPDLPYGYVPPDKDGISTDLDELKWLTTARIRHVVFGDFPMLDVNSSPLNNGLREKRNFLLNEFSPHFRSHIHSAYESIRELYDYDLETEQVIMCRS